MKKMIIIGLIISSCGMPELKKLKSESKGEIDSLISELKLEKFDYGIHSKTIGGQQKNYFKVRLYNIDDSLNFEPYNVRIIKTFDKSGYNLKQYDFVVFYYYKSYSNGDLFKFYRVRARDGKILEEAND
jgi:hypothetical protein